MAEAQRSVGGDQVGHIAGLEVPERVTDRLATGQARPALPACHVCATVVTFPKRPTTPLFANKKGVALLSLVSISLVFGSNLVDSILRREKGNQQPFIPPNEFYYLSIVGIPLDPMRAQVLTFILGTNTFGLLEVHFSGQ